MADEQNPERRAAPAQQIVNVGPPGDALMSGITGWWKLAASLSFAGLVAGSFLFLQWNMVVTAREDRLHDRDLFERAIKLIQDEDNRRTGEVKGAMDKNTEVMRDLINEIRAARHGGVLQERGAVPKAVKPPEGDR